MKPFDQENEIPKGKLNLQLSLSLKVIVAYHVVESVCGQTSAKKSS